VKRLHWIHYLAYLRAGKPTEEGEHHTDGHNAARGGASPDAVRGDVAAVNAGDGTTALGSGSWTGALCFSPADIDGVLQAETTKKEAWTRSLVDLASVNCHSFVDILFNGFASVEDTETDLAGEDTIGENIEHTGEWSANVTPDPIGWITLDVSTLDEMLPSLLRFGRVFVGTDKGGSGLVFVRNADSSVLAAESADAAASDEATSTISGTAPGVPGRKFP
jgi:hypothetical protein